MYRLRLWLAGIALVVCAVAAGGGRPSPASPVNTDSSDSEPWILHYAIWGGERAYEDKWRLENIQYGTQYGTDPSADNRTPGASQEAPGLRLLDREPDPLWRMWPWALLAVAAVGFFLLFASRHKPHGRVVAHVRSHPQPIRRRRRH